MLLPRFDYHEPSRVQEACAMLCEFQDKGAVLAGGTDLLVSMKKGKVSPSHVVTLSRIQELKGIKRIHGSLSIGACVTVAD
jgi:carbon-monoxide dehydrogenase medium subunit